ncbi:MAG TPA: alpha/beta hydrolase [Solirubrobacteraceae bacterium]|nr:alpha/beta hydrolase [Solirubrobacteraceae bacterium]
MAADLTIQSGGVTLSADESGDGPPVLLLHGLTATRRYVVMGSKMLERSGHRVIKYDARAHGHSSPAPSPDAYTYDLLADDAIAVLDAGGVARAVLAGASMGAHTLLNVALRHPERVAGVVVITPAYSGDPVGEERLEHWDRLSKGLRTGGVEGFIEAMGAPETAKPGFAATVLKVTRQRLSEHDHPEALADALSALPRSRPFASLGELAAVTVPAVVVASNDDADPEHPEELGIAYAQALPNSRLITDAPGSSPVAWQGSRLSQIIAEVVASSGLG